VARAALPNEVFGGPGNDHLTGDLGNDRIDGGSGRDAGHGGHEDGRADWIESLETIIVCQTPY
jgi:Ca2+-binding RTX toxin-like protein